MDVFKEPYWNLFQVLAWVSLEDRQLVQEASDWQKDHGTFMEEVTGPGGKRELVETSVGEMDISGFLIEFSTRGGDEFGLQTAKDAVLAAAQEGKITVHGLENGEGDLQEIPAVQWASLEFSPNLERADPKRTPGSRKLRSGATHWNGLKFNRPEVQKTWRRGCPKGTGSLDSLDTPLLEEMEEQEVESRREQAKRETAAKYARWYHKALRFKEEDRERGRQRSPTELSRAISRSERVKDPVTRVMTQPKGTIAATIKRVLNDKHPGWAR